MTGSRWWFLLVLACPAVARPAPSRDCVAVDRGYGPNGHTELRVEVVADGLEVPWGIAFLPEPEQAALATVHPDFATNHLFYIYYSADTPRGVKNRVERWRMSDDLRSARPERMILDGIPSAPYHDGGRIAFGPDGMLYIATGDATEPRLAQDPSSLAGKILRVDGGGAVPANNPTRGSPVYISGARNVQAFDWREDGALAIAEHGPSGELGRTGHDRVWLLAHPSGANLGWPAIYGCQTAGGFAAPALSWREAVPPGGGAFYRDGSIAAWRGDFLIGTLKSHHLHRVRFDAEGHVVAHDVELADHGRLRTVVIGPDHELYVATSNCDGRGTCPRERDVILRVTAQSAGRR